MDDKSRSLANTVGEHVVARDFAALHALFAPWLASKLSENDLESSIDLANDGLAPPQTWTIDEGLVDLESLREPDEYGPPSKPLPREIRDANYRGWICVQFQPDPDNDEGFNVCFDLWFAAVEHDGNYRIGYLEAAEAT